MSVPFCLPHPVAVSALFAEAFPRTVISTTGGWSRWDILNVFFIYHSYHYGRIFLDLTLSALRVFGSLKNVNNPSTQKYV